LASTWRCVAATVRECQRHTLRACRFAGLPIGARPPPSDTSHASSPTAARTIVIWFAPFEWAAVDRANVSVQSAIRSGGSCGVQRCVSNRATPADPAGCQTMNGMETLTQNGQSLAPSAANSNLKQISRQTRARPLPRALPALPSCASTVTTVANELRPPVVHAPVRTTSVIGLRLQPRHSLHVSLTPAPLGHRSPRPAANWWAPQAKRVGP